MHRINLTNFLIILIGFCMADGPSFSASRPGNCNPSSVMTYGYGQIESGEMIKLTVRIGNKGKGTAKNSYIKFYGEENFFIKLPSSSKT